MSKLSKLVDYIIKHNGEHVSILTRTVYLIMMIIMAIIAGQILKNLWRIYE
jgi:hypothetical protein